MPSASCFCRWFVFLVILVLEIFDCVSDWIIYNEANSSERGLVYGPIEPNVVRALLAFCIMGTIFFVFEMVIVGLEKLGKTWWKWVNEDLASMITIWAEDLPQIALNLHIVRCREEPISVFQLTKAALTILAPVGSIAVIILRWCRKRNQRQEDDSNKICCEPRNVFRGILLVGLLINASIASCVFAYVYSNNPERTFRVPKSITRDEYDELRFFQNVSVFVHHPDYDAYRQAVDNNNQFNWVQLMSINDIRNSGDTIHYRYVSQDTTTELRMALWKKVYQPGTSKGPWELRECGKMDLQNGSLTLVDNSTCQRSFITDPLNVYITFSFLRKPIFGDILYNIKVATANSTVCLNYDNISDDVDLASKMPIIHYFRENATLMDTARSSHLAWEGGVLRFFRNDGSDLLDVKDLWRTGYENCKSTGNMGPTLRRDIPTGCDI